jgi:hypothetical protein
MGNLATAQWIAIGCIVVSLVIFFLRHRNWDWRKRPADAMTYMMSNPPKLAGTPATT